MAVLEVSHRPILPQSKIGSEKLTSSNHVSWSMSANTGEQVCTHGTASGNAVDMALCEK